MLSMLGVEKSRTTPYHPQGDPQPERFNRTLLLNMLGTLDPKRKRKWSQHIGGLVHVYSCTQNEATGNSPYFLMFAIEARLPIDLFFRVSSDGASEKTYLKYVSDMRKEMQAAYRPLLTNRTKETNKDIISRFATPILYIETQS